ncbi:hypothetical protein LBMAG53_30500 [Planctomycetota bacterium]|nr:hypothetical protein LBMAG53_30500 [Planctomycetota bacterium]
MSDPTATQSQSDPAQSTESSARPEVAGCGHEETLAKLAGEVAEWRERCARLQAEFDNSRRRLRKEAEEAGDRAIARAVRPFLDQIDNLGRALDAAKPEAFTEFAQGVQLVRDNLISALGVVGVVAIPASGAFDPTQHEAIAEFATAETPKGHIVQIHRTGWKLKDQLVRTAQVVVAKPPA